MIKKLVFKGLKYNDPYESIQSKLQNMINLAKRENSFVYDYVNMWPVVVEPDMTLDEAAEFLRNVQNGKTRVGLLDHIPNLNIKDATHKMGVAAKYNDFVICALNGIIFRILKHMSAEDAFRVYAKIIHYNKPYDIPAKEGKLR